ncbi:MAG TPA: hypothetical protein VNZ06_14570 [Steroidobacteraceae bacterium]|nr:hypothetical protein [Steroidobacteraceae bacterium]
MQITLGPEIIALDGPWKFRIGDNLRWAAPDFDDAVWESLDLTPQFGAHDADVGLMGYVPGWEARGHRGYSGYAWYRLRVSVTAPPGQPLALVGPTNVDSAYQIYLDGRLLGGIGDFTHSPPAAYGTNRPATFPLVSTAGPMLVAVRVWMGSWDLNDSDSGGIHIAPALGTKAGAEALYQIQWMELIRGYFLEIVLAVGFVVLAAMVCSLMSLTDFKSAHLWLSAALLCVALMRANQAVFFWGQFETVKVFELITNVLLVPLMLGAWTIAWASWLNLKSRRWIVPTASVLTMLHIALQCLRASWFHGAFPKAIETALGSCVAGVRLLFVLLTLQILVSVVRQPDRERWFALCAIVLICVGLFAQELSQLGVPGIWFPFGTGVSRTQYAYAAFDIVFFALILQRLMQTGNRPVIASR